MLIPKCSAVLQSSRGIQQACLEGKGIMVRVLASACSGPRVCAEGQVASPYTCPTFSVCKSELTRWWLQNLVLHWAGVKGIVFNKQKKEQERKREGGLNLWCLQLLFLLLHILQKRRVFGICPWPTHCQLELQCSAEQLDYGAVKTCQ